MLEGIRHVAIFVEARPQSNRVWKYEAAHIYLKAIIPYKPGFTPKKTPKNWSLQQESRHIVGQFRIELKQQGA